MPELEDAVQLERRSPRTKIVAATVLAGLALAACQVDVEPRVEASATTSSTSVSETRDATQTTTFTATPERTTKISATSTTTVPATKAPDQLGLAGCLPYVDTMKYQNHEYEVCTAYIANAAGIALQGMYKFGNNRIGYLADGARHHFETRYWNQPRAVVEQEVASWPKTGKVKGNDVTQTIALQDLSADLAGNRAFIRTQESWRVTSPDGTLLYEEPLQAKEVTMCRGQLPGHPLHHWMVVSNKIDQNLDCIEFDQANGLDP